MEKNIIYEEKIFLKVEIWILNIVIVLCSLGMIYMMIDISVDLILQDVPFDDLFFLLLIVMFLPATALGVAIIVRYTLYKKEVGVVKMTPDAVIVKHGLFKRTISWEKIDDCYLDKTSAIWCFLGMGRVKGKWRLIYGVLGYPRVVLSLKDAKFFKEFVFSIKNPEEAMKIINEKIKKI